MTSDTTDEPEAAAPRPPELPPEPATSPASSWRTLGTSGVLRIAARWALVVAAIAVVLWLISATSSALIPFGIGLVLAYLMLPGVNYFSRRMPRALAILVVYVIGLLGLIAFFSVLVPLLTDQFVRLLRSLPTFAEIQQFFSAMLQQYRDRVPEWMQAPIEQGINDALPSLQASVATYLQRALSFIAERIAALLNTVTFILGFISLPIWLFYVLNDQDRGRRFLDQLLHPRLRADVWNVIGLIDRVFSNYVRGQLILCVAVGLAVGLGLTFLQLLGFEIGDYILVLALIAGVTEFIPVLGPTIGAIPGVVLGFAVSPGTGIAVLVLYILVQQLENSLLVPRIIGESVGVHPAVITVLMIIFGTLYGLIGIILAAPIAAAARDLFVYTYLRLGGLGAAESGARVIAQHAELPQAQLRAPRRSPTPQK